MPHPGMYSDDDPHLDGVRRVCLALPEAVEVEAWGWPSFRAGAKRKMAAIYDRHSDDGYALTFKPDPAERGALLGDLRFFAPWYWGDRGWVALNLETAPPDRAEVVELGRERPHSTGVESVIQTGSAHRSVSAASTRISRLISGAALRNRLL